MTSNQIWLKWVWDSNIQKDQYCLSNHQEEIIKQIHMIKLTIVSTIYRYQYLQTIYQCHLKGIFYITKYIYHVEHIIYIWILCST